MAPRARMANVVHANNARSNRTLFASDSLVILSGCAFLDMRRAGWIDSFFDALPLWAPPLAAVCCLGMAVAFWQQARRGQRARMWRIAGVAVSVTITVAVVAYYYWVWERISAPIDRRIACGDGQPCGGEKPIRRLQAALEYR